MSRRPLRNIRRPPVPMSQRKFFVATLPDDAQPATIKREWFKLRGVLDRMVGRLYPPLVCEDLAKLRKIYVECGGTEDPSTWLEEYKQHGSCGREVPAVEAGSDSER